MNRVIALRGILVLVLYSALFATSTLAQEFVPFNPSPLAKLGDTVQYGVYNVRKIGEGIYQMNNLPVRPPRGGPGALGVDNYLICGPTKALMIDLGNDYTGNGSRPERINAAEELRSIVSELSGGVPIEVAVTHIHGDHSGMTRAFLNRNVTFWAGEGEDMSRVETQLKLDPSIYKLFKHGEKSFDLGGGRVVETFLVRGHTNGGTIYIMRKEGMLFTGDCFGNGEGLGTSAPESIKNLAVDSEKLVDYIISNFSPYERYALRVYSGHSWENGYAGMYRKNIVPVDVGYLDWRFIQDMASCANEILKGSWLIEGSGLRFVEYSTNPTSFNYNASAKPGERRGAMIYGIGSMMGPLQGFYDAAGIKMPQ